MQNKAVGILVQVARDSKSTRHGCDAEFAAITDDVGIKWFSRKKMCERNYQRQALLAEHGLAPKIGQRITFETHGETYYGFFTEIVETIEQRYDLPEKWNTFEDFTDEDQDELNAEISELRWKAEQLGMDVEDLHYGNIGWNKSGRMVIIDVSRFMDKDGYCYG